MVESVNVLVGHVPPEFGFKSGGVIEVRTSPGKSDSWLGNVQATVGSDATRQGSSVFGGPMGQPTALTLGVSGQRSDRFLDPVHPDNLHNSGNAANATAEFNWLVSPSSTLSVVGGFEPLELRRARTTKIRKRPVRISGRRICRRGRPRRGSARGPANTVSQVAGYHRSGSAALVGSEHDTPLFISADRSLRRTGVLGSVTHHRGKHVLKAGVEAARLSLHEDFSFFVTDEDEGEEADLSEGALEHDEDDPFVFAGRANPTLFALYAQDSIQFGRGLTVDFGVRARSRAHARRGLAVEPAARRGVSRARQRHDRPRVGRPVLPAAAGRESAAGIVRAGARAVAVCRRNRRRRRPRARAAMGGRARRQPDARARRAARRVVLAPPRRKRERSERALRHDASSSRMRSRAARPTASTCGSSCRAAAARPAISATRTRASCSFGPVTGGLFLEDEVIEIADGTAFTPDHDQRHVAAFGASYDHPRGGFWASFGGRYESGTPLEVDEDELDELMERPGSELVNFETGRVQPRQFFDVMAGARAVPSRRHTRSRVRGVDSESHRRTLRVQLRQSLQRHAFRPRPHISDRHAGEARPPHQP